MEEFAPIKHFQNLHRQENRPRRYYQKNTKELNELQAQRKEEQKKQEGDKKAALPKTYAATPNGFEFTDASFDHNCRDMDFSALPAKAEKFNGNE